MKNLMDERDRDRAFAYCRGDAFDVAPAHVTDRKHCGEARFKEMRRPCERPVRGGEVLFRQIRPRLDEPVLVERDTVGEPARTRNGSGHREDVSDVVSLDGPGLVVAPAHALEMVDPFEGHDLRLWPEDDDWVRLEPANQISRHAFGQSGRTDEHMHALCGLCQEHG